MESTRLRSLITNVPTISRRVKLESTSTWRGAAVRGKFALLFIVPTLMMFDQNGGLLWLGMTSTTLERHYKMRPDYATGRVFAAER